MAAGPEITQRVYERLCLAAVIMITLVVIPANLLQHMPWVVDGLAAGFGLVSLILYRLSRRGIWYPSAFLGGMVLTIDLIWFPNAGAIGSIPFFFLPAVVYAAIFYRGRLRATIVALIVLDALALMALEQARPSLVTPFVDESAMRVDLAIGLSVSALLSAVMLWIVTDSYDHERHSRESTLTALDDAREEFARLFQMNPDAVYLIDPALPAYVDVNHGFERLTGWNKPEVVGRSEEDVQIWVDVSEHTRFYDELARLGHVENVLSRFRRRDSAQFWGSTSAAWVEMSGRRLLLLTTRDVTTRIDAQRRDAESRALLAALLDSTKDGVWQVEPKGFTLTAFNAAFAERFRREWGRPLELGRTLEELASPELGAIWRAFYQRALIEGAFSTEYDFDQGRRTSLVSLSPVTHDGEVFGVSVFSRDITELKRAAEERAAITLQLLQSQKMESLGSLAGGVAHDFNNMLTAIMGYAELLLADESSLERQRSLLAITQAATRSRDLTGKLLAFGRRGKNIVQSVDLGSVVHDSLHMLRPTLRSDMNVMVDMRAASRVDGDPSQMSQVIVNLCINANEAMPTGGTLMIASADVTLDARAAKMAGVTAGDYVKCSVTDTGIGMADDVRVRIFEPFFTTKFGGQVRGTGLGLSTVYGIIQSHGGNILVESQLGIGTSFTVLLPKGALTPEPVPTPAMVSSGSGLILIAEDEPMVREMLTAAVEGLGYGVLVAEDGEVAVRVFAEHHADVIGVVLDLKMPRKSGREAFIEMRAIDPNVPVLVCSGYGDNEEAQSLISLGAKGLLTKPFRIADLSRHLATMGSRLSVDVERNQ